MSKTFIYVLKELQENGMKWETLKKEQDYIMQLFVNENLLTLLQQ